MSFSHCTLCIQRVIIHSCECCYPFFLVVQVERAEPKMNKLVKEHIPLFDEKGPKSVGCQTCPYSIEEFLFG
jgi:hypothetical protein